jgi:alpha-tubulin suppressor-like RCC1 family protein
MKGKVFAWGVNQYGQLGDGTTGLRKNPVAVVDTNGVLVGKFITSIAAGSYHVLALSSDGNVYSWGRDIYGQLGDGSTTQRTNPYIISDTNNIFVGKKIIAIAGGDLHSVALYTSGTCPTGYTGSSCNIPICYGMMVI